MTAPDPKITSTYTAFTTFLDLNHYYEPLQNSTHKHLRINPKKFYNEVAFELRTHRLCVMHNQPKAHYPLIYLDARVIHDALLNTKSLGTEIATDILENKQDSDINAEIVMKRIDFAINLRDTMNMADTNTIFAYGLQSLYSLLQKEKSVTASLFNQDKLDITPEYYEELFMLADQVDQIKKGPEGLIVLQNI